MGRGTAIPRNPKLRRTALTLLGALAFLGDALVSPTPVHAQGAPADAASNGEPTGAPADSPASGPDAPSKEACVKAYESAQTFRQDGELRRSRNQLLVCGQETCPDIVKGDCLVWLGEVESELPTLTFAVLGPDGHDVSDVRVYVDDDLLIDKADGQAVPIDPGPVVLRFELAGQPSKEVTIVVRQGEKNRPVEVSFVAEAAPPPAPPDEGVPIPPLIIGGVGIVGMGLFATFGLLGNADKSDAEDTCAPNCDDGVVSDIETKYLVADISLAVGATALVVSAVWLIADAASGPEDSQSAGVRPIGGWLPGGGGFAGVSVAF